MNAYVSELQHRLVLAARLACSTGSVSFVCSPVGVDACAEPCFHVVHPADSSNKASFCARFVA